MAERIYINDDWQYLDNYDEKDALKSDVWDTAKDVRIPHTVKEVPFHYFDESEYQKTSAYKKIITGNKEWEGKRLLLTFDGVAHDSKVFVNGNCVGTHHCGYAENIHTILQDEISKVFVKVLECAGVYKRTEEGQKAFDRFIEKL